MRASNTKFKLLSSLYLLFYKKEVKTLTYWALLSGSLVSYIFKPNKPKATYFHWLSSLKFPVFYVDKLVWLCDSHIVYYLQVEI